MKNCEPKVLEEGKSNVDSPSSNTEIPKSE